MSRAKENPFGRSGRRKNRPGAAWWGLQFLLSQVEQLLKAPQGQAGTRWAPLLSSRRHRPEPAAPACQAQAPRTAPPFPAMAERKALSGR